MNSNGLVFIDIVKLVIWFLFQSGGRSISIQVITNNQEDPYGDIFGQDSSAVSIISFMIMRSTIKIQLINL